MKKLAKFKSIKYYSNYLISTNGKVYDVKTRTEMKSYISKKGNIKYTLLRDDGKRKSISVEKLLVLAYNYEKTENTSKKKENLKSYKDSNRNDSVWSKPYAEDFDNEIVKDVCELIVKGYNHKMICNILNVKKGERTKYYNLIRGIKQGKYSQLTQMYNFENEKVIVQLNEDRVHEICRLLEKNYTTRYISKLLDVNESRIRNIRDRNTWLKISDQYNI